MAFPSIFEMCVGAGVGHKPGPKTCDAFTPGSPNTPIHDAIRARVHQLACERLGSSVAHGIVRREIPRYMWPYIVEGRIEIRKV